MLRRCIWLGVWCLGASKLAECTKDDLNCAAPASAGDAPIRNWVDSSTFPAPPADDHVSPLVELLIGVKTSVKNGATSRQAIRDTWGNKSALPPGVRLVFLGCRPDLAELNESETAYLLDSIAVEQRHHDDLLIDELVGCRDAYDDLVNKVLAFFQWTSHQYRSQSPKRFVMVADDDVYLRADALVALLHNQEISCTRFYGGQVWATHYQRSIAPRRSSVRSRYYLSSDHYPMDQLPPFANGPHYIVSTEVAAFIGRHRDIFRGVGGDPRHTLSAGTLDDVSVALWLMGMQIHPRHLPQFGNLRDTMCRNDYISYADLSTTALYQIHRNLASNRTLCNNFSYATWLKESSRSNVDDDKEDSARHEAQWSSLTFGLTVMRATHKDRIGLFLQIGSIYADSEAVATVDYYPSSVSYFTFCPETARHVAATFGLVVHAKLFCENLQGLLLDRITSSLQRTPATHAMLALLLHNVGTNDVSPTLRVAVSQKALYAIIVLENLLTQAYPGAEVHVFDEASMTVQDHGFPDIVMFSTADESNPDSVAQYYIDKYAASSRLVLLHPHESKVTSIDRRVIVIAQSYSKTVEKCLYIPLASTTFGACADYTPTDLLLSFAQRKVHDAEVLSPEPVRLRQFCLDHYVPRECHQPHREYFFSLLNGLDRVDTISPCPNHQLRMSLRNRTRQTQWENYLDLKTDIFALYKFTIAFEDVVNVPGYISDKIVAAFLAGSIPIYYGHSSTVAHLFNSKSFIDCGSFSSLRACAAHVLDVHASPILYESIRQEPPITNLTAFYEVFSWHPIVLNKLNHAVRNSSLSDKLRSLLNGS